MSESVPPESGIRSERGSTRCVGISSDDYQSDEDAKTVAEVDRQLEPVSRDDAAYTGIYPAVWRESTISAGRRFFWE